MVHIKSSLSSVSSCGCRCHYCRPSHRCLQCSSRMKSLASSGRISTTCTSNAKNAMLSPGEQRVLICAVEVGSCRMLVVSSTRCVINRLYSLHNTDIHSFQCFYCKNFITWAKNIPRDKNPHHIPHRIPAASSAQPIIPSTRSSATPTPTSSPA